MRIIIIGTLAVAGMFVAAIPSSAAPIGPTQPQAQMSLVAKAQSWGYCRRLRRACEYKDVRGEQGEGNCRRYRRVCGGRRQQRHDGCDQRQCGGSAQAVGR